jgi:hypothetical protein
MPNRLALRASLLALAIVVGCTGNKPASTSQPAQKRTVDPSKLRSLGTFEVTIDTNATASGGTARALTFVPVPDVADGVTGSNPPATLEVWSDPFSSLAHGSGCGLEPAIVGTVHVQSAFTETLRNLHAGVTSITDGLAHQGCDPTAPPGSPVNVNPVSSLGAFDYQTDLPGTLSSTGSSLGAEVQLPWWFLHYDSSPQTVRAQFWAEPFPPAPVAQTTTHLEAGAPLEWFTDADPTAAGLSGLIDTATDSGFTALVETGAPVSVSNLTDHRRIFSAGSKPPGFASTSNPGLVALGVRFQSDSPGVINGIYYYRGPDELAFPGGAPVYLYDHTGAVIGTGTDNDGQEGWAFVNLSNGGLPVQIDANLEYTAARVVYGNGTNAGGGFPAESDAFATAGVDRWPLHVPVQGGVFSYDIDGVTHLPTQPTFSVRANYFMDVDFAPLASFAHLPAGLTPGSTYSWRVRNRFTGSDGATPVDGTLVTTQATAFVYEPAPSNLTWSAPNLTFTTGPHVTSALVEICTDSDPPTDLWCVRPAASGTATVSSGAGSYAPGLGTGTYWWRVTQQYSNGSGTPSAWTQFTVP